MKNSSFLMCANTMRQFFNSSSLPIAFIDKEHHITYANKALAQLLSVGPDDLVGKLCYEGIVK